MLRSARSRLRSLWRSLLSRVTGTRLDGGCPKPSAYTGMKEPGTPTQVMVTTAVCSFYSLPGYLWMVTRAPTSQHLASRFIAPGWFISETDTLGASGAPLNFAGWGEAA